ncbi:TOMM precursor leader peptide-binding protein [Streptomyces sp. HMX87]|uniref:TOMM precursor leader peptide-binding protein n=1 Tax=Streptomyces sp. HMX87 TaxID=3390849 RepID=UPI003A88E92C
MERVYLLRQDSLFLESADGVFLRSSGGDLFLKGKSVRQWLVALAPRLASGCTEAELYAGLDTGRAEIVRRIVDQLHAAGLLLLRTREPAGLLTTAVERRFAEQIAFLAHDGDHPRRRFGRWRRSRLLAVGDGSAVTAAVLFWLRNGAAEIAVAWTGETVPVQTPWDRDLKELKQAGAEAYVEVFPAATPEAALAALRDWAPDALLLTPTSPAHGTSSAGSLRQADSVGAAYDGAFAGPLVAAARAAGCAFVTAGLVGPHLVKGPLVASGGGSCPTCVRLWFSAHAAESSGRAAENAGVIAFHSLSAACDEPGGGSEGGEKEARGPVLYPAVLGAVGSELAMEIFRHVTGTRPADLEAAVVLQDPLTLSGRREPVPVHPRCPGCARPATADAALNDLRALATGALDLPSPSQPRYARYRAALAPTTGFLRRFDDDTLPQTAVKAGAVLVAGTGGGRVIGFHERSVDEARCAAVEEAAVRAAGRDPVLSCVLTATAAELAARGETVIPAERLLTPCAAGPRETTLADQRPIDWVPALRLHDLDDPRPAWVPGDTVRTMADAAAGHGVGATLVEVALGGTLSALLHERLAHRRTGRTEVSERPVPTEEAAAEAGLVMLPGLLRSGTLSITELTAACPARVVTVRHASPAGTFHVAAVGLERRDALRAALVGTAGRRQLGGLGGLDGLDGPVPVLPRPRPADPAALTGLVNALRAAGRDALLVATPPAALGGSAAPLRVGRVLLTR